MSKISSSHSQEFIRQLNSFSQPHFLTGHFIVLKHEGLCQTHIFRVVWEKFKGLLGFSDRTNTRLIQFKVVQFLWEKRLLITTDEEIRQIRRVAKYAGIESFHEKSQQSDPFHMREIVEGICQKTFQNEGSEVPYDFFGNFFQYYKKDLAPFSEEVEKVVDLFHRVISSKEQQREGESVEQDQEKGQNKSTENADEQSSPFSSNQQEQEDKKGHNTSSTTIFQASTDSDGNSQLESISASKEDFKVNIIEKTRRKFEVLTHTVLANPKWKTAAACGGCAIALGVIGYVSWQHYGNAMPQEGAHFSKNWGIPDIENPQKICGISEILNPFTSQSLSNFASTTREFILKNTDGNLSNFASTTREFIVKNTDGNPITTLHHYHHLNVLSSIGQGAYQTAQKIMGLTVIGTLAWGLKSWMAKKTPSRTEKASQIQGKNNLMSLEEFKRKRDKPPVQKTARQKELEEALNKERELVLQEKIEKKARQKLLKTTRQGEAEEARLREAEEASKKEVEKAFQKEQKKAQQEEIREARQKNIQQLFAELKGCATEPEAIEMVPHVFELFDVERIKSDLKSYNPASHAATLFALFHLDFMNLDAKKLKLHPTVTLPFFIQQLDRLLKNHELDDAAQQTIKELISSYQLTYATALWQEQLVKKNDPASILAYKQEIKKCIINTLTSNQSLTISTGYSAFPAGHIIALQLSMIEENGEQKVQGAVINRGEGTDKHMSVIIGSKEKRQSILTLLPTSLEELSSSSFLDCMLDLNFTHLKSLKGIGNSRDDTLYTIDDFYEGLLPLWPREGKKIAFSNDSLLASRTPQRGGTCSVKPYLTQLKDVLGEDIGGYCKFQMQLASLENYLEIEPITLANKDLLLGSLNQLNRSALKLHTKGRMGFAELEKLNKLSHEIKAEIKATAKGFKQEVVEQTVEFSSLDPDLYELDIRPGEPFAPREIEDAIRVEYQFPDLANCNMPTLSVFLTESVAIIRGLCEAEQLLEAYEYAVRVLAAVPSCASPIWKALPTKELEKLSDIQEVLVDKSLLRVGMKINSPNEACFHLKCLAITIKTSLNALDADLVAFVLRQVPTHINRENLFGGPSSAALANEANCAYAIIDEFFKGRQSENSVADPMARSNVDTAVFQSVEEGMKHPEMRYLLQHVEDDQNIEDDQTEKNRLIKALELIADFHSNEGLSGRESGIRIRDSSVKDYALVKKQYFMQLIVFLVSGFSLGDSYSQFARLGYSRYWEGHCSFTQIYGFRFDVDPRLRLIDSQGLNKHERMVYQSIFKSDLPKNQNCSVGESSENIAYSRLNVLTQEIRELLSLNCKPDLMITQLIHFFEGYPHRFKNGLFRAFFLEGLFQTQSDAKASNIQNCMKHPLRRDQLFAFFKRAFKRAEKEKALGTQCFLLKIWIQSLVFFVDTVKSGNSILNKEINSLEKEIAKLFQSCTDPTERSLLTHTLVASYPYIQESNELKKALFSFCEEAYFEIQEEGYVYAYRENLKHYNDVSRSDSCNRQYDIIEYDNDAHDGTAQFKEDFEKGVFDIKNQVVYEGMTSTLLPDYIANSNLYQRFFSTNLKAKKLAGNLYEFNDCDEQTYRIQINEDHTLSLYLKKSDSNDESGDLNENWYEYREESPFAQFELRDHPCSYEGELMQGTSCWYQVGGKEVLILTFDRKQILLKVTDQAIQKGSDPTLFLATTYDSDPTLEHVSQLTCGKKDKVLLWKTADGDLKQLEIPSLNLSFHLEKTQEGNVKWISDQYPGYFLDTQAKAWDFEPFTHYVLLRGVDDRQMALMPDYTFESEQPKFNVREPPQIVQVGDRQVLSYVLEADGSIKLPHQAEHLLYYLYLSLTKREYPLAHRILKKLKQHPIRWGEKALELAACFDSRDVKKRDSHPHATSIRLQLKLLAAQSLKDGLDKDQKALLSQEYFSYLDQLNNMGNFLLSEEEEIACLNLSGSDPRINLRKQELGIPYEDSSIFSVPPPVEKREMANRLDFDWIHSEIQAEMVDHCDRSVLLPLKMRLGDGFVKNFLFYYQTARSGGRVQKNELMELLQTGRFTNNDNIQSLLQFLLRVMQDPEGYPSFEKVFQSAQNGTLSELLNQLNAVQLDLHVPKEWTFAGSFQPSSIPIKVTAGNRLVATAPSDLHLSDVRDPEMASDKKDLIPLIDLTPYLVPVNHAKGQEIQANGLNTLQRIFTPKGQEDRCVETEYQRILKGIVEKKEEISIVKDEGQSLDLTQLTEILNLLSEEIETLETDSLKKLQKEILILTRKCPIELETETHAALLTPLEFSELLLCFGREDDQPMRIANPSLAFDEIQEIKGKIREYLLIKRHQQQCIRLHKSACTTQRFYQKGQEEEVQAECQEFMRIYESRPCYTSGHPHLLLFEVMGNVIVRQDQYDILMKMAGSEENEILEAKTGFGKSKVLIPLWLYLTSLKRETLSMMTVPSPLFIQQVNHLKDVLGNAYSQSILEVHFSREQGNDLDYLKWLNKRLDEAMQKKMCVIADIHSMHHLVNLAYKENLCQEPSNREVQEELLKIREILANKLSIFIDESRECLDIRHRYDDALGVPKPVNLKHCQAVGKLYEELIIQDAEWAFEFLPETVGRSFLSEKRYNKKVLPVFVEKVMKLFKISAKDEEAIWADLQGIYTPACEAFYETLTPGQLKEYALYKQQLNLYLRRSLNRNVWEHYGLSKKFPHRFAVPYTRGKPNEQSEFSTLDDLLNFTIQANLKEPFAVRDIQQFADALKTAVLKGDEDHPCLPLCRELLKSLNFSDVDDVMDLKPSHIIEMQRFLNENTLFKLRFIVNFILPQITFYEKKVSSSAYNLLSGIRRIKGAAGIVNSGILPSDMKALDDPKAPLDNLLSLVEHSQNKVYEIPDAGNSLQKLENLLKTYVEYTALVDVDGSFREMSPQDVAQAILEHTGVKAVNFYDHAGRNLVLLRNSKTSIPFEECRLPLDKMFTYFPQSSVVGSDTSISLLTKAIVTVNKSTEFDLFMQGAGRMRGLQKGQRVGIVVNESDSEIIQKSYPGSLTLKNLLRHMMDRQGSQRGKDQFFALRLMLEDQLETYLNKNYPDKYKEYIAKSTQSDSLSKLRGNKQMLPAQEAVEQLVVGITAILKDVLSEDEIQTMNFEFLEKVEYAYLPASIPLNQEEEVIAHVEVEAIAGEVSLENEVEQEQEQEQISEEIGTLPTISYTPVQAEWDGYYTDPMQEFKTIIDERICVSPNYLRIAEEGKVPLRKPAYQYLIARDPENKANPYEMVLLDLHDADKVLKDIEDFNENKLGFKGPEEKGYYLYSGRDLIATDSAKELSQRDWENDEHLIKLGILRKVYSADPYLTKVEKEFLEDNSFWVPDLLHEVEKSKKFWPKMLHLQNVLASLTG